MYHSECGLQWRQFNINHSDSMLFLSQFRCYLGFSATIVITLRWYYNDVLRLYLITTVVMYFGSILLLPQWFKLSDTMISSISLQRIKVWRRMTRLTWWMKAVSSLCCKGLGCLLLSLLKEEFCDWVFPLRGVLPWNSAYILCHFLWSSYTQYGNFLMKDKIIKKWKKPT